MGKFKDLTGQKFGHLIVKYRGEDYISPRNQKAIRWWCECDCGNPNLVLVLGSNLSRGHTTSCGCVQKETGIKNGRKNKKYNTYDLTGEYGIGYTSKGEEFWFDLEDYDLIKDYCWHTNKQGYFVANDINNQNKVIRLNRLIMHCDQIGVDVDHIKHKLHDNRKSELRICLHQKNNFNHKKSSRNTSGVCGVNWHDKSQKWMAQICAGEQIYLGIFDNFDEAVKIRKEAEEKHFGEYSYDNSQAM